MGAHGKPYDFILPLTFKDVRYVIIPFWAPRYRGSHGRIVGESSRKLRAEVLIRLHDGTLAARCVTFQKKGKSP